MSRSILVLGGDGYLGWPTAMAFSAAGHTVAIVDNLAKRGWEAEIGVQPLFPLPTLQQRIRLWHDVSGKFIEFHIGDLTDYAFVARIIQDVQPEAIIHFGEQPSAPFSMIDARHATLTQTNNVVGTLNLLFALRDYAPDTHLVKLGTMGEYGTPNIDIEEGYLTVTHNGRSHTFMYPKTPGSLYHLSKVHDSHNIEFAVRVWDLRATDLNQGVVYGVETDETALDPRLATSFHYDEIFGTVLNRFCVEAVIGQPLTVYGKGGQTRGFLNIRDTIQCIKLAVEHPPARGQMHVFNQFTEQFTVQELAERVQASAAALGWPVEIAHLPNPRSEAEEHYYNAKHEKLLALGLQPHFLGPELIDTMLTKIAQYRDRIDADALIQHVHWNPGTACRDKH